MLRAAFSLWLGWLLLGSVLLLSAAPAGAQTVSGAQNTPHGYDFLTVTVVEFSPAKILITPAFQGKAEVPLENNMDGLSNAKNIAASQHNALVINQQLSDLTVAGWELTAVFNSSVSGYVAPRYLFRKPRP